MKPIFFCYNNLTNSLILLLIGSLNIIDNILFFNCAVNIIIISYVCNM